MAFFFLIKDDFRQKVSDHNGDSMVIRDAGFIHYIASHPSVINKKNVILFRSTNKLGEFPDFCLVFHHSLA